MEVRIIKRGVLIDDPYNWLPNSVEGFSLVPEDLNVDDAEELEITDGMVTAENKLESAGIPVSKVAPNAPQRGSTRLPQGTVRLACASDFVINNPELAVEGLKVVGNVAVFYLVLNNKEQVAININGPFSDLTTDDLKDLIELLRK